MMETDIDVIVEIPRGSRNKYEVDHITGAIWLDRTLFTATQYPADYGFVPNTLAEDGDPLDVLVLVDEPTFPGCRVRARAIGVCWMTDEAGPDAKILAVPRGDARWAEVNDLPDVPAHLLKEIQHFFEVYKALEPSKMSDVGDWEGVDGAVKEIHAALQRYVDVDHTLEST